MGRQEELLRVRIKAEPNQLTAEEFISIVFGKSVQSLAREIWENKEGKYQALYQQGTICSKKSEYRADGGK